MDLSKNCNNTLQSTKWSSRAGEPHLPEADSSHAHYQLLRDRALPVVLVNASSVDLAFAQASTDD